MKCTHNSKVAGWLSVVTGVSMVLHFAAHFAPLLLIVTPESRIIALLEHPAFTLLALGFIPLMIYHFFHDRNIHKRLHFLEEENSLAKGTVRWIRVAYDKEYSKHKPNWSSFALQCHWVLKGLDSNANSDKFKGDSK